MKRIVVAWAVIYSVVLCVPQWVRAQETLVSGHVTGVLPLEPLSDLWTKAKPVTLPLAGQMITTPLHINPAVTSATVRSLNNGEEIAFLVSWRDATANRFLSLQEFSDAVAAQIPYTPSNSVPLTMGGPGQRVLILHWTAARQEDIDHGYFDTSKAEPNYTYDWYPHAKPPYKYPQDWTNQYALNYIGGEKVLRKNTLPTPVREVVAEGYGSSTWKDVQGADGKGIHQDDHWYVVMKRKFAEENTSNPEWGPGKSTFVTFAVWDGAKGERGARKSLRYAWIPLKIVER